MSNEKLVVIASTINNIKWAEAHDLPTEALEKFCSDMKTPKEVFDELRSIKHTVDVGMVGAAFARKEAKDAAAKKDKKLKKTNDA